MTEPSGDGWLPLDEAAAKLGVSRLRLREAIAAGALPARRDNRGFWRVSAEVAARAPLRDSGATVGAEPRIEWLFDEIEEVTATLGDRDADVARLVALVARQQEALERALRLAGREQSGERPAAPDDPARARSDPTPGEAGDEARVAQMTGMVGRALQAAAGLEAEATRQREIADKQRALLDRLFALAQASLDAIPQRPRGGWFSRWRGR